MGISHTSIRVNIVRSPTVLIVFSTDHVLSRQQTTPAADDPKALEQINKQLKGRPHFTKARKKKAWPDGHAIESPPPH